MRTIFAVVAAGLFTFGIHAADGMQVVIASDEATQISVPSSWTVLELNDVAEIEVGNAEESAYLIVINELKEDLFGWNIEKHSRVTLGGLLGTLAFPAITGPKSLKIGGSPAVQYEVTGALEGQKINYIHTTVDGPKRFSQILAWTIPSREATVRPQLLKAIESFRETKE
jgi:hypothetical protein